MKITARAFGATDVGLQREHNEDGFLCGPDLELWAVLDGMGGGRSGDYATKIALDALPEGYRASAEPGAAALVAAVQHANQRIFDRSENDPRVRGIGAAIAALSISGDAEGRQVHCAHVGDCRVYRYRRLALEPLTRDHTLINDYRDYAPDITEEQIAELPRNVITRALGMSAEVKVDCASRAARAGDLYLLCTDGVHGQLDDGAIADVLRAHIDVASAAKALIDAANARGGTDNIAVVLVQLGLG